MRQTAHYLMDNGGCEWQAANRPTGEFIDTDALFAELDRM
jgi:hypothetical protein